MPNDFTLRPYAPSDCPAPRITTHASRTARPFFERRGYRVLRAQTVVRHGVALENFVMEKWLPPR